ncbi:MAG: hypothetical protein KF760_10440 [Candidatus Eremiobacteraeota bacterium]|nr:hypothetical protein [Candidatus Eremiobacteraeota bacterium]MCW5870121.1 hypothetical protein [Candidatus Eremiobacteraeota bacterium]
MENQVAQSNTIYPHLPVVQRVIPWTPDPNIQSKAVAGVQLRYGPIQINGKLIQGEKRYFLSMPCRKHETSGEYYDHASVLDRSLLEQYETLAIAEYQRLTGLVLAA